MKVKVHSEEFFEKKSNKKFAKNIFWSDKIITKKRRKVVVVSITFYIKGETEYYLHIHPLQYLSIFLVAYQSILPKNIFHGIESKNQTTEKKRKIIKQKEW